MKSILFVSLFFFGVGANAATTSCTSSDARFQYVYSQSNGGAPIEPTSSLAIDGTTVIAHSPFGGAEIRTAELKWVGNAKPVKTTKDSNYETSYYLQDAQVVSKAESGKVLFEDTVFCQAQRYIGPPIP